MDSATSFVLWDLNLRGERALAAIGVGQIDSVDHLAVQVGGVGSDLGENGVRRFGEVLNLHRYADSLKNGSAGTVMYYGYEAPPGLINAVGSERAKAAGGPLHRSSRVSGHSPL